MQLESTGNPSVLLPSQPAVDPVPLGYGLAWALIGAISIYDAYLVTLYRSIILSMEQNPICAMLISWDPEHLSYFLVGKAAGTSLVLLALVGLYCWQRRLACAVIGGVLVFQLGLLVYLNSATYY